ncbi:MULTISPECIES: phosphodiester glycosidase family protein [unclassified Paenibacillus]|uniref:phosphodiester glycosidase family protein n=1 Tax=unclassified Paenibacillus TaxID=185978 RepID=UPI0013591BA5|nr:phosphodiester glycosidase family protein [Paenibacillus sp. An7]
MAINYSYFERDGYRVIKTHVSNIVSEVIKKPVCSTNNYGINGGFFASTSYSSPPYAGLSISYDGVTQNPGSNAGGDRNRGTFFTFTDNGVTKAGVQRCTTMTDLKDKLGLSASQFKTVIGGGSLNLPGTEAQFEQLLEAEQWEVVSPSLPLTRRSGIGFKNETNGVYAYLVTSTVFKSLYGLRDFFKNDLGCYNAIFLDGSGSVQMQVHANGELIQADGTDPSPGRYVWNMIKLINKN